MFLQTRMILENTVISPFSTENEMVPLIFKWFNTPDIFRYMGDIDQFPFTFEDAKNYYNSHKKDTWLICEKNNDLIVPIGYTGLFIRKRHSVGIFRIAIAEESFKGKGHAKRATLMIIDWAFKECDIRNVHLSVSGANKKAIELYKKVGFRECGTYKNSRYENGKVHDEILMEFQREWFKNL